MKNDELIIGRQYHTWLEGSYLGIATFQKDKQFGNTFKLHDEDQHDVAYLPDEWKLITMVEYVSEDVETMLRNNEIEELKNTFMNEDNQEFEDVVDKITEEDLFNQIQKDERDE